MAKTKAQKEIQLKDFTESLTRAKAVVFTDFKGMSMKQLSELRDKLREQNAEFIITKNTLLKIALKTSKNLESDVFEGPTATLFAYDDEITPIKALVKALKDNAIGKIKAGILGIDLIDKATITRLSTLPSKDELRGKVVGVLVAPLQGIVGVLNGNLRNLVYALDQIRIQRGGV